MINKELKKYLMKLNYNTKLYLAGKIPLKDLECDFKKHYRKEDYHENLMHLYELSPQNFKMNLLINNFNYENIQIIDYTLDYIKDTFYTKVMYFLLNRVDLTKYFLSDILQSMDENGLFTNMELYFLGIIDCKPVHDLFKCQSLFEEELNKLENLRQNIFYTNSQIL